MKTKTSYLLLLLGFAVRLEAQHVQIVDQTRFENFFTATAPIADGGFFAAAKQSGPPGSSADALVLRYDASGHERWRTLLPGWDNDFTFEMQVLSDTSVVLCGVQAECLAGQSERLFLARMNPDGAIRWHVYEGAPNTPSPVTLPGPAAMTFDQEGRVWVVASKHLHAFDLETGGYAASLEVPAPLNWECIDVHYHPADQQFYLLSTEGIERFDPLSGTVALVADLPAPATFYQNIVPLAGGTLLAYTFGGQGLEFGSDGVVSAPDFTSHGVSFMAPASDGRLAVYHDGTVYVYGSQFALKHQFDLQHPSFAAFAMHWQSGDRLLLAGFEAHTVVQGYFNSSMWAQSFSTIGQTLPYSADARLVELITVQQPTAQQVWVPSSFTAYFAVSGAAFQVRVRNAGQEVLREVTINASNYGFEQVTGCAELSFFRKTFEGLNLAPGEDVVLDVGLLESPFVPAYQFFPWQVCVWTSMPNGMADAEHANNIACQTFAPTVSVNEPEAGDFSLFPNPANDECTLTWGENLRPDRVRVYDGVGRLVHDAALDAGLGRYVLDVGAWPAGVYAVALPQAVLRLVKH